MMHMHGIGSQCESNFVATWMFTPCVPYEVWDLIFRRAVHDATATPLVLSPLPYNDVQAGITTGISPEYILSMRTKLSLVLVSKSWRNIATPLLYERIYVSLQSSLEGLTGTLLRCTVERATSHLGLLVRSLIVDTVSRARNEQAVNITSSNVHTISTIISLCSNLVRFRLRSNVNGVPGAALSGPGPSLRCMELNVSEFSLALLNRLPLHSLEILALSGNPPERNVPEMAADLKFVHLHTLHLFEITNSAPPNWIATWDLPSLRRMIFGGRKFIRQLATYSGRLPSYSRIQTHIYTHPFQSGQNWLGTIIPACQGLEHLVLHERFLLGILHSIGPEPSKLTRIDILLPHRKSDPALSEGFFYGFGMMFELFLACLGNKFPSLRLIRLRDFCVGDYVGRYSTMDIGRSWAKWSRICEAAGVGLEGSREGFTSMP
jgi:hypothetical protein